MRELFSLLLVALSAWAQAEGPRRTMVDVRFVNARELVKSGFLQQFGVVATTDPTGKFILITGERPADVYAAEAALKKIDAKPQNVELTFQLIGAVAQPVADALPPDAEQAVRQLRSAFPQYKGFRLLDTAYMRVTDGGAGRVGGSFLENKGSYEINVFRPRIRAGTPNTVSIEGLTLRGHFREVTADKTRSDSFNIDSNVDFKEGQKLVVGKSSVADHAAFLVVTAKVVD